jgi:hypothetical protein
MTDIRETIVNGALTALWIVGGAVVGLLVTAM